MPQKSPRGASAPRRSNEANHLNGGPPLPAAVVRRGNGRLFIVKDHTGHSLAYVYFEERLTCSRATRHGASPPTRPSCVSC